MKRHIIRVIAPAVPVRVTDTDYDVEGRTVRLSRPEGVLDYGYDQATSRLVSLATSFTAVQYGYDVLGRLASVTETRRAGAVVPAASQLVTAYSYDRLGQVTTITITEGAAVRRETTHSYDPVRHWLVGVSNKASGVAVSSFSYTRRADGQITQVVETNIAQADSKPAVSTTTTTYTYDPLDRLTKETVTTTDTTAAGGLAAGSYTIAYTLDAVGNRLVKDRTGSASEQVVASYNGRDQLTQEVLTGGPTPGTVTLSYDANGAVTSESGARTRTQSYDARGRLVSATVSGATSTYTYTPDGIRSSGTEAGQTVLYLVDVLSLSGYTQAIEERTASGLFVASTLYGLGLDPLLTTRTAQVTGLFLADGHSGVRQVVGLTGAVLQAVRYDAFGATVSRTGASYVNPIGYRGERFDATLGQY